MSSASASTARAEDPFDLQRFVKVQSGAYEAASRELRAGRKSTHWMWFIFPQMRGLGFSNMAHIYGIGSLAEARAYLAHPVLGSRLRQVTGLVLAVEGRSAAEIMGSPDDMKLRSSMTLFAHAAVDGALFQTVLERYFDGKADQATTALLGAGQG